MNRKTLKFLFWVVIVYIAILLFTRGLVSSDSTPTVSLTAIPLILMAIIIIRDLTNRSASPSHTPPAQTRTEMSHNTLEFLSRQIDVTAISNASYFDDVIRTRLRELLVTKASLQTGMETDRVRRTLSDSKQGPKFLHDDNLYALLYGAAPEEGSDRIEMIRETVELIENWKP